MSGVPVYWFKDRRALLTEGEGHFIAESGVTKRDKDTLVLRQT